MADRMTAKDYANKVLDLLKQKSAELGRPYKVPTPSLALQIGVAETSRDTLLKTLERLYLLGILGRTGQGKYVWFLKVETWNREDPFNGRGIEGINVPSETGTYRATTRPTPVAIIDEFTMRDRPTGVTTPRGLKDEDKLLLETVRDKLTAMEEKLEHVERTKIIEIKRYDKKNITLSGEVFPKIYDRALALAQLRRNVLLIGPAGCGKTYIARLISKSLGLDFGTISCTTGMSESHLLGKSVPNLTTGKSEYHGTEFVRCYEKGGVFLLDEIDAGDPNMLLALNAALANGYCNIPNRPNKPQATQHDDFVMIATANTFGRGANRSYSGRNQLDESTLDRFRIGIIECDYDDVVEKTLCPDDTLRNGIVDIRKKVETASLRRIVSTRFLVDAHIMASQGGWKLVDAIKALTEGWTRDELMKVGLR